jgi:hypothetical protein
MRITTWAAAKLAADGTVLKSDRGFLRGSFQRLSAGVYEGKLVSSIGVSEACPIVTLWHEPGVAPILAVPSGTLLADEVTVQIELLDSTGAPIDAAFNLVVFRYAPS